MTPSVLAMLALASLVTCARPAFAADAPHPHHGAEHFYASWMMPDRPAVSCCSREDCAPAQAKFEGGAWWARWTDADEWTRIPDAKVERSRDMPDGQAHLCGRRNSAGEVFVYCFGAGAGG